MRQIIKNTPNTATQQHQRRLQLSDDLTAQNTTHGIKYYAIYSSPMRKRSRYRELNWQKITEHRVEYKDVQREEHDHHSFTYPGTSQLRLAISAKYTISR